MKKIIAILFLTTCISSNINAQQDSVVKDTFVDTTKEDKEIDEVVQSKALPSKDKVQYFSQVTKYGFKNLFKKYSYNTTESYSTQVNPNAAGFIQDYMRRNGPDLIKMKGWGQPYFNLIDNIFSQYGLPRELKYIAVIESNLKILAPNRVGATGPWQFMPTTAREFGLVVNGGYDERKDYYKSTHAAARYLLTLYKQLHDWLLVMAAYNGGPGRVYSAIKKSGSRNFWNLQYYLPEESRTYVKKFIATHYIMEGGGGVTTNGNADLGNEQANTQIDKTNNTPSINSFDTKPYLTDIELEGAATLPISGKFNSLVIAKNLSMDILQFNHYNPSFDNIISNTGNYDLRLPTDKMQLFVVNKYPILNECVQILFADNAISNNQTFYNSPKRKKKLKN